jgi:hypothetical protein
MCGRQAEASPPPRNRLHRARSSLRAPSSRWRVFPSGAARASRSSMRIGALLGLWMASAFGCSGEAGTRAADAAHADATDAAEVVTDAALDATDDAAEALDAALDAPSDGGRFIGVRADRPAACPATEPIADSYDWAPPRLQPSACTEADLDAIRALFQRSNVGVNDLQRAVSASCFACAYTAPDAVTWGALTVAAVGFVRWTANEAGCLVGARTSEACGRAYSNYQQCAYAACDGCDIPDLLNCYDDPALFANGGACAAYLAQYRRSCPFTGRAFDRCVDPVDTSFSASAVRVVGVMCGAPADGGT